jgi:two-component system CheB/CheR fusion protein
LIETSRDYAVFVVDLEGRVLTWNSGAERVLGYSEGEIVGESSFLFFTPEDRAEGVPEQELRTALREGPGPATIRGRGSRITSKLSDLD